MNARWSLVVLLAPLAGCGTPHPATIAEVAPSPVAPPAAALPPGATPGMLVPERQADGSFATPNRGLTGAAALWHLRAGLNVAALSCPGDQGAAIRAGYNGWLRRDKPALARAAKAYAASFAIKAGAGSYDDAMTRLYNFFAQTPARPGLCAAAAAILAEMTNAAVVPSETAEVRLATLDQPFTDFYRAYDAWRSGGRAGGTPAALPATTVIAVAAAPLAPATAPRRVGLTLDLSTLPPDTETVASR